jgi:type I restriction enzyme S subunit
VKFKLETEFQETEIGKIPREWKIVKLKDIGKIVSGFTFPLELQGKRSGKYPFVKVNDMNNSFKYIYSAENYVDDDELVKLKAKPYPPNTIIFPKIGMAVRLNKYRILRREALFDNNIAGVIVNNKVMHHEFVFYYFQGKIDLMSLAGMTTVPSITKTKLENILIPYPPIGEQLKIAEILTTVDRAIEVVDAGVARLEGLKKALMRELLTGRIRVREDGKPAFYRETEFQETEIGKIPSEWKIVKLKDIAVEIKSGFASGKRDEADGIIHLRMFNIGLNGMLSFDEVIKVPKPKDWRRYLLRYGDILLVNTSGSEEHIGKVAFFEDVELECTYSNHLTRIRVVENSVDSRWVYFVLHYLWQIGYFKSLVHQQAGGQRNIPLKAIENLSIILPPINEARKIAEFLSIINTVIKLCREEKAKLDHLKRGLMNLLLTGKVRVVE